VRKAKPGPANLFHRFPLSRWSKWSKVFKFNKGGNNNAKRNR